MWRLLVLAALCAACRTELESPIAHSPPEVWSTYDALLREVVTDDGYVDYDALEANREPLDGVVRFFAERRMAGRSDARGALWLNAYNAFVLFAVLEEGRPDSVKDVEGWLPVGGAGFFLERSFGIDANHYTLWEIEHERIRLRRLDFRVHAALNCASTSCPPLKAGIYTAEGLGEELDEQMRIWVNDPERGVRLSEDGVVMSPLFDWYQDDFVRWSGGRSPCLVAATYADPELKTALMDAEGEGCQMKTFEYDWSLNHRSKVPPRQ